jgi:hypothetical protein
MIPWANNKMDSTASTEIFFDEQKARALAAEVEEFKNANFDAEKLVNRTKVWGVPAFKKTTSWRN